MSGKERRGPVDSRRKTGRGAAAYVSLAAMLAAFLLLVLWRGDARAVTNYLVTNTNDSGDNSLRWAIEQANANAGADAIIFAIPGDGPFTITPTSALPAITGPVTINGYSQDGSSPATETTPAVLMIEINGASAGSSSSGLSFVAGSAGSTVKGLAIKGFNRSGIAIQADSIIVEGNHIGTNIGGTAPSGNNHGILVYGAAYCTIGGATAAKRNVISGNNYGCCLEECSPGNTIQGNYIGTNASGTAAVGNTNEGVYVDTSYDVIIGGETTDKRNVISGNKGDGVYINGGSNNNVQGNFIGTNAGGTAAVGNAGAGLHLENTSNNTIGGDTTAKRNLISGNGDNGVLIEYGSTNNLQGNYIGTNASGTAAVGNGNSGVEVDGSTGNTIGGGTAGQGNVISGNPEGIRIVGGSANNLQGNFIGTNASGTAAVGNTYDGVRLDYTTGNTIGGDTAAKRNVISGNGADGVNICDNATNNNVQGNFVGTDAGGTTAVGNAYYGIEVSSSTGNTVGGGTAGLGNVISGNGRFGVYICQSSTSTTVRGNLIGTNADGTASVGNTWDGVAVVNSTYITIGGDTAAKRNVISGNKGDGVFIYGGSNNNVKGNFIGTNASGTLPVGNAGKGVFIDGSTGNTVGGGTAAESNIISSNADCGIYINGGSNNNVKGNFIGTDASGTVNLGNHTVGVYFKSTTDCDVTGNRIWNNHDAGVFLYDKDSYGIRISLNSIYNNDALGIDLSGVAANDGDSNNTNQPNRGYDYPVFSATQYTVLDGAGSVSGTAPPNAWVELYKTGPIPDPSGYGEGHTWLATVQANGGGAFSASLEGLAHGDHISALAISPAGDPSGEGNTSEFAANALIKAQYIITPTAGNGGSITPSGAVKVNHGADQHFTITPDDGYRVADVVVDGKSKGAVTSYTFTNVTGNHSISASFAREASPASVWYLAEGSTDWGYDCYISIANPNDGAVNVKLTYMTSQGPVEGPTVPMPALSQATVFPRETLGAADFSTKVECLEKKAIAVDRTMYWTGPGAPCCEAHCASGVTAPATTWYLPEGSSAWGFECWLLIQNPNGTPADCEITWMIEGEGPVTSDVAVDAGSRGTFNMAGFIGEKDASIKVSSDLPVIPERAMYRNSRREGHDSTGTTTAAQDYYLAEGCTGFGFTTYVLVQNPQETETDVTVTYQATAGPVPGPSFTMPPKSRRTINVNDTTSIPGPDPSFSTHVHGSQPIIAERAMYWNGGPDGAQVCHDSIGLDAPHTTWFLADGQTSEGRETWTLVQNPNDSEVTVEIAYLTPDGTGNVTRTETIAANSRMTFNMLIHSGITGRAAIMVTCRTAGKKIMVERAMYWNSRGAGTDTIGGYAD